MGDGKTNLVSPSFQGGYQGSINIGDNDGKPCAFVWFFKPSATAWDFLTDCQWWPEIELSFANLSYKKL